MQPSAHLKIITSPWTANLAARCAVDLIHASNALPVARSEYYYACSKFCERDELDGYIDRETPTFRRATRMEYAAFFAARQEVYNANRRLQTAVRRLESNH